MKISLNEFKLLLMGCSFLGTGGGGRIDVAQKIIKKIRKPVETIDLESIKDQDIIITVFGVGGLKKQGDINIVNKINLKILKSLLKDQPKYLIPVEIGPVSVCNLLLIASKLNLPVINGDLVGYRSSPEVFLEGITLNKVNRLPIVASNSEGDSIILYRNSSAKNIESILRDFSSVSKSKVYVAGYPMKKKCINNFFGNKSLLYALTIGEIILKERNEKKLILELGKLGIKHLDTGTVMKQEENSIKGFSTGKLIIKAKNTNYEVIYKNEFLVLLRNSKVILTCPDSILLLDLKNRFGINNGDNNINRRVAIFWRKSEDYWRMPEGMNLFSPKNLGFNYKQKLIL